MTRINNDSRYQRPQASQGGGGGGGDHQPVIISSTSQRRNPNDNNNNPNETDMMRRLNDLPEYLAANTTRSAQLLMQQQPVRMPLFAGVLSPSFNFTNSLDTNHNINHSSGSLFEFEDMMEEDTMGMRQQQPPRTTTTGTSSASAAADSTARKSAREASGNGKRRGGLEVESDSALLALDASSFPVCFNLKTKSQWADLEPGNLAVSYSGLGKASENDAAVVKSNTPVSSSMCGIFYWEYKILSKGRDGYIAVGVSTSGTSQARMPGNDEFSWAYHASDGRRYHSASHAAGTGVTYGPPFSTGDVVGCIVNFLDLSISFTRNGVFLGTAWKGLTILESSDGVYPTVGMRSPGETVSVNFGLDPFKFDILHHYRDEKARLFNTIRKSSLLPLLKPPTSTSSGNIPNNYNTPSAGSSVNFLVIQYLINQGYYETARSLYTGSLKQELDLDGSGDTFEDIVKASGSASGRFITNGTSAEAAQASIQARRGILDLLLDGRVEEALKNITTLYPLFRQRNPVLYGQLMCLKFVETIRILTSSSSPQIIHTRPAVGQSVDVIMQVDESMQSANAMDIDVKVPPIVPPSIAPQYMTPMPTLFDAVTLSQVLKSEFASMSSSFAEAIDEIVPLVCYKSPLSSPLAYILDIDVRNRMADLVNCSLLEMEGSKPKSPLESLFRQCLAVDEAMGEIGCGSRNFLQMKGFLTGGDSDEERGVGVRYFS